jgi:Trypsin-co-occurring domain 2
VSETSGRSFTLAELINHTSDELRQARRAKRNEDGVMVFKSCELELSVTVKAEAGGGIRFWVVDASSKVSGETVSKIKLSFDANPENRIFTERPGED